MNNELIYKARSFLGYGPIDHSIFLKRIIATDFSKTTYSE
jgi:hypothetical protein